MNLSGSFVLPEGALLERVGELPEEMRRQISAEPDDYTLSLQNTRTYSKVLDRDAAALVREFERPNSIAKAVARYSHGKGLDAEIVLMESVPMLMMLIDAGLLVAEGSVAAAGVTPSAEIGLSIADWTIVGPIQTLEDCEVYQVRSADGRFGALKIARPGLEPAGLAIDREARVLKSLSGVFTPRLLAAGAWEERRYLILEWRKGSEADIACGQLRRLGESGSLDALGTVVENVIAAYCELHERGIVHGDVHPRNVLIDRDLNVTLIDFGLARFVEDEAGAAPVPRGGVSFYLDPEFARAALAGSQPPTASFAGEQYALAAMLYALITGSQNVDFSFERAAMLRQIADETMRPFEASTSIVWPEAERVLARALEKDAQRRYASLSDFARAWPRTSRPTISSRTGGTKGLTHGFASEFVTAAQERATIMHFDMTAPTTSVAYGSAGLAYALFSLACSKNDGELLSLADAWCEHALRTTGEETAFLSEDLGITAVLAEPCSLYHGPLGAFTVAALIASARGDGYSENSTLERFSSMATQRGRLADLNGGFPGSLLACALLLDALPERRAVLEKAAAPPRNQLLRTLRDSTRIDASSVASNVGMAHGAAGLLYAMLTWLIVSGEPFSDIVAARLREVAALARPVGRGLEWGASPSWCNGSAGFVFLWTQAYRVTKDSHYLDLAEGAAWHAWEMGTPNPNLCCGTAGRAYALLNFYRASDQVQWLHRAERLLTDAVDSLAESLAGTYDGVNWRAGSLYKGDAALAVLETDLIDPKTARMPLFELAN